MNDENMYDFIWHHLQNKRYNCSNHFSDYMEWVFKDFMMFINKFVQKFDWSVRRSPVLSFFFQLGRWRFCQFTKVFGVKLTSDTLYDRERFWWVENARIGLWARLLVTFTFTVIKKRGWKVVRVDYNDGTMFFFSIQFWGFRGVLRSYSGFL